MHIFLYIHSSSSKYARYLGHVNSITTHPLGMAEASYVKMQELIMHLRRIAAEPAARGNRD